MIRIAKFVLLLTPLSLAAGDWPAFRGPNGDGVAKDSGVTITWSATENVVWKAPLAGIGHSSPIVSHGRIFLTAFIPESGDRVLVCFDRAKGKEIWRKTVFAAPPEKMHKNNTPASATPTTDGNHIFVTFLNGDKIVVACYDLNGMIAWKRDFSGFESPHGFCGSPVLFERFVILNGDSDGEAFIAALDKKTGDTVWKTPRPNRVRSCSTPLFITVNEQSQMVLAGSKSIAAFDPRTGKQIWLVDSTTDKFVATVAYADATVFATGTSPNHTLMGIRPDGSGNVTRTHVSWSDTRGAAYVPSPLGVDKRIFVLSDTGIATMLEARNGKRLWSERLGSRLHHASPLLINDRIFCVADDGKTYVLKAGAEFEVTSVNSIGEECHATPAVSDGKIFIRSTRHLWCLGKPN